MAAAPAAEPPRKRDLPELSPTTTTMAPPTGVQRTDDGAMIDDDSMRLPPHAAGETGGEMDETD